MGKSLIGGSLGGNDPKATKDVGGAAFGANFGEFIGSFFNPKASEIFEARTATRIFDDHQNIALTSIRGGQTPKFNENENLYGFSIYRFKSGFLGGWEVTKVDSLLGGSLTNALTGGDQLANVSSYFFNVHPSALNVSEPFATTLVPTQGGGIYAESQGVVLTTLSIAGTTGYRPSLTRAIPDKADHTIPHQSNEPTGFINFLKLRNLFRNYSDLKKNSAQSYNTYMVWYNGKEQESWFFEPSEFITLRDASSPFTYRYEVRGTLTQKVNFSSISSTLNPNFGSLHFYLAMLNRAESVLASSPLMNVAYSDQTVSIGTFIDTVVKFGSVISKTQQSLVNFVQGAGGIVAAPVALLLTLVSAAQSIAVSTKKLQDSFVELFDVSEEEAVTLKNVFYENLFTIEAWARRVVWDSLTAIDLIKEQASTPLTEIKNNHAKYNNTSYLHNVDEDYDIIPYVIPDTQKSLKEIVLEATGDITTLDWVIEMNQLEYPYISNSGTGKTKFNAIKSPGEIIFLPYPSKPIPPTIFTKLSYKKIQSNPYVEMLGRDIKLNKTTGLGGFSAFEMAVSPSGDLDLVEGEDNIAQTIDIKLNTTRGELPLHPGFGLVPVIGRKGTRNLKFDLYLSLNDTLLSDGRIEDLSNVFVKIDGDKVGMSLRANIIGSLPYVPVDVAFKG